MASNGYFSNHSQTRITPTTLPASTTTTVVSAPGVVRAKGVEALVRPPAAANPVTRSGRLSLSLTTDKLPLEKGVVSSGSPGDRTPHPLRRTWVFWFHHRPPGNKVTNYEDGIKRIANFGSIESFWSLWTHLQVPSLLTPTTDYLLFHSGVRRPVWEDPLNITGGKWILRLRKGLADRLWEDLVMAVIGDQFDAEICGCVLSVRTGEDIISVWNRDGNEQAAVGRIKDTIKKVLNLPPNTIMEYKSNNDSLHDRSSFRHATTNERT